MQALLKAKRWASGEIELEHQSLHTHTHTHENEPDASGNVFSNYENNEVNTYTLNSSELNAATERNLSLLSSHTSAEHGISEQNDPTYVLVDTNVWKNLLSTVKCPECDMNNLNIIKTTQLGMASKLELEMIVKENGTIFLKIKYKEVQAENLQDELNEISNRYTIMFSLSTVLLTVEFLSFLGGFSMFIKWQNQIYIL
ncbi:hypothetical protein TNCT_287821 [Trichonephila clavata]|uniref:Uncharacterized protein n=1 Tax=Trichonephila clavata TaxID=2740835 RepID=A0A8X6GA58_TRICU|nr:hypothetical protein TNCT_287821 [Trichonephila clavata]